MGRNGSGRSSSGRGRGRGGGGGRGSGSSSNTSTKKKSSTERKTLEDHVYYIGSAKQASDYVTITNFLVLYIRKSYPDGHYVAEALENRQEFDINSIMPQMQESTAADRDIKRRENRQFELLYEAEIANFIKRKELYAANMHKAYALLYQQCNKALQSKLQSRTDFLSEIKGNPIKLLNAIQEHSLSYMENKYPAIIVVEAFKNLLNLRQREDESIVDYTKRFKAARDILKSHLGGELKLTKLAQEEPSWVEPTTTTPAAPSTAAATTATTATNDDDEEAKEEDFLDASSQVTTAPAAPTTSTTATPTSTNSKAYSAAYQKFLAYLYMENADRTKYGTLLATMSQTYSFGTQGTTNEHIKYPQTIVAAQHVLDTHRFDQAYYDAKKKKQDAARKTEKERRNANGANVTEARELSFAQMEGKCYKCGKPGHKSPDCKSSISDSDKSQWAINKTPELVRVQHFMREHNDDSASVAGSITSATPSRSSTPAPGSAPSSGPLSWMHFQYLFHQHAISMRDWILLDSCSSVDLFCNPNMVQSIRASSSTLQLGTNAGVIRTNHKATLPKYGDVWYNNKAITNVLSLGNVVDRYRVTFDSKQEDAFHVHTPEKLLKFRRLTANLYASIPSKAPKSEVSKVQKTLNLLQSQAECPSKRHPTQGDQVHAQVVDRSKQRSDRHTKAKPNPGRLQPQCHSNQGHNELQLYETVMESAHSYSDRQKERAKQARILYHSLGCPSMNDLKAIVKMNSIKNNPVTLDDIKIAQHIYGPDIATVKGKTTRRRNRPVVHDTVELPKELYKAQRNVELCIDALFVCGMIFLTTISRHIMYRTAQWVQRKELSHYSDALVQVLKLYLRAGFKVTRISADREFKPLLDELQQEHGFTPNYANAQEHVAPAERNNRTIQERVRAVYHRSPLKTPPKRIIEVMVTECTKRLNYFPAKGGCSAYYSPREILHKVKISFERHCRVPLLQYVLAHDEPQLSNTLRARALDCLYVGPTDNAQGGHECYHIPSKRLITRAFVTPIPFNPEVIESLDSLGRRQGITDFKITDRRGSLLYNSASIAGVGDEHVSESDSESDESEAESENSNQSSTTGVQHPDPNEFYEETDPIESESKSNDTIAVETVNEDDDTDEEHAEEQEASDAEDNSESARPARARAAPERLNIGNVQGKSYAQAQESTTEEFYDTMEAPVLAMIMTELNERVESRRMEFGEQHIVTYSLQQGLKKFGERAKSSAHKEMKQLHDRECFKPIHKNSMNCAERKRMLRSLIFLTEKRDGTIKSRQCADGSPQRLYMDREAVSSPTVSTESTLLTSVIDAAEGRDVATCDIPNAFVQTELDTDPDGNRLIMKIAGACVSILCEIDPTYREYVVYEGGQPVLYVQLTKAIYGLLVSAMLFYRKLTKALTGYGFEINPYDPCVANKMVNGKQLTITWHVDDVKSSHVDPKVNDDFLKWVKDTFGQLGEVKTVRGPIHDYLGMVLDFSRKGQVSIDMSRYIKSMVVNFPQEELKGYCKHPWDENLFRVDETSPKLPQDKAELFHRVVAQGLFVCKRGRPDISPAIAFLTTRVREPTLQDWEKLCRLMRFLKKTQNDILTLSADGSNSLLWHVDASFAVHPDFRSHTGATFSMGRGAITSISRKQGMNSRSSTEAEVIAADEVVGPMIWTKLFLEEQGYPVRKNTLFQDNRSAMLLESNGRKSAGKRSRHLNIRFFFVTDQKEKGNINIEYCPTDEMTGDYMTKPLLGKKFDDHRNAIMGSIPLAAQLCMIAFASL